MKNENFINQIIRKLEPLDPCRIILFGSYAHGNVTKDSDIDLLVVTSDEVMPRNFKENMKYYLKIANALDEIRERISMDLIVHTIPMYKRFLELDSMFARDVLKNGRLLYESNNQRVVEGSK